MLESLLRAEKSYAMSRISCSLENSQPLNASCSGGSVIQQLTNPATNCSVSGGALTRESCSTDSADDDSPSFAMDDEETIDQNGDVLERSRFRRYRSHEHSDKLNRRAIANSNERRRMQSINAGFQQLKELVRPGDTEKLSKAAVLQHAVEFIIALKQEKQHLLNENDSLLRLLGVNSLPPTTSPHGLNAAAAFRPRPRFVEEVDEKLHRQSSKRARLDDDLSSMSSSSVSSDEGVAELATELSQVTDVRTSKQIGRPPRQLSVDLDPSRAAAHTRPSVPVDCEPAERGRVVDNESARNKHFGNGNLTHSLERWTAASNCGSAVWNCPRGTSTGGVPMDTTVMKPEQSANEQVLVKQELVAQVGLVADHSVSKYPGSSAASSGDAVVPIAAIDDKVKVDVDDDRMFSVDCKWTSPKRYDDDSFSLAGPQVLSVRGGTLMLPGGGLQSSSSMSQRNLETILEAIRFLEGDQVSCQSVSRPSLTSVCS